MWEFDSLWAKARVYAVRASAADGQGAEFPFWSILTLEMLARAALSSVHPVLLADPRDGQNIMFALGLAQPKTPKSIVAKTVFSRCNQVIEDFTEDDVKRATALIEMRNEELHTGGTPLEGLSTGTWLVDYYRLCATLLAFLEKELADLFGDDEASTAKRMIDAAEKKILGEVQKTIAAHRKAWAALAKDEQQHRREAAGIVLKSQRERTWYRPDAAGDTPNCPACSTAAWVTGEVVRTGQPRVGDDEILQTFTKLPKGLSCAACELRLEGEAAMHAAGLGDLYDVEIGEDPASFYGIETSDEARAEDYYDDAYGND